jgi:pimeloyl-ACP methyl ester carboxylesterase
MAENIETWFGGGQRVALSVPGPSGSEAQTYHIFCREEGAGPWLTLLHGFPTCSWDYAHLVQPLKAAYRLLLFDFLGFGDSDKPANHAYSLFEQAALAEAAWAHFGVKTTRLVAHDYGSTVAVELLARQQEGRLAARVERVLLMNAGLYVDVQRPVLAQTLLQKPLVGPALSRLIGERAFSQQFASVFSQAHPVSADDLRQHWSAIQRREGVRNYHRLIAYLGERRQHKARWEAALEEPGVPLRFLWGMQDPVSGAHMAVRILERRPQADLHALEDVGHYPQLEAPGIVAAHTLAWVGEE